MESTLEALNVHIDNLAIEKKILYTYIYGKAPVFSMRSCQDTYDRAFGACLTFRDSKR